MSNPYGPSYPGGGEQNPYGGGYGGGYQQPAKTDGLSIVAFVLSLSCCLSFVGMILGFVGLGRTKNGQRKGRWAAVSAIVIGLLATIVSVGATVFFVWFASGTVTAVNAEVGQCADRTLETEGEDTILLREADCDEPHDVEVIWVGTYDDVVAALDAEGENVDDLSDGDIATIGCAALADDEYVDIENAEDYGVTILTDSFPAEEGDGALCYLELANGDELDAPLLG